jgi:predicted phosphatase
MARILANAGLVKYFFYFPVNPNPVLQKFMDQVIKILKTSTDEDDAPDALTGLAAYLEKYHELFKEL